jgi:pimeloyl-ACP methyl ester carboxylesterase
MVRKIHSSDSSEVEYWDTGGDKPPLLLLHGFGANAEYQWFMQLKTLKNDYRLVMPNLIGFGETRTNIENPTVLTQMDMICDLLNHIDLDECIIIGASYGGLIGAELARRNRLRIKQLVLMGAPVKYIYEEDRARVKAHYNIESIPDLFVPKDASGLRHLISASNGKKNRIPTFFLHPFYAKFYQETHERKLQLMHDLMELREEFAEYNYDLDIPVELIWGENDPLVLSERGKLLHEHIGNVARLHLIPKGGHMANMVQPKIFNRILRERLIK